jgi:hypothetical protein
MKSSEIVRNLSISVVEANSIFLPFNGPLEMIRKLFFIFLTELEKSVKAIGHPCLPRPRSGPGPVGAR